MKQKKIDVKNIPLHLLKPYENNAKIHSVKQLEGISESIRQFGFLQPIVIDKENEIVAGHGRYEAAAALGYEELPCIIASDLNDEQIKAYRILDNKLAEGGVDPYKLSLELSLLDFNFAPFKVEFNKLELKPASEQDEKIPQDQTEFTVLINCNNEHEQQKIYEEMQERGFDCKLIM